MRTVLTNGCFDVLHSGHIDLLWKCKALGDKLIVAVNSDESVKKLKGESRPINGIEDRVYVLRALKMIDDIIVFNETNVAAILSYMLPDVWAKGGDYSMETLNKLEVDAAEAVGAEIVLIPISKRISTTSIINRL